MHNNLHLVQANMHLPSSQWIQSVVLMRLTWLATRANGTHKSGANLHQPGLLLKSLQTIMRLLSYSAWPGCCLSPKSLVVASFAVIQVNMGPCVILYLSFV